MYRTPHQFVGLLLKGGLLSLAVICLLVTPAQAQAPCGNPSSSTFEDMAKVLGASKTADRSKPDPCAKKSGGNSFLLKGGLYYNGRSKTSAAALKIIKSQLSRGAFDWAVTDGNAEKAHLALMQLNDKEFNKAVRAMATSKNGWLLERYLDQLDSDKLVQAFVARLGRSASTSTAKEVMRNSDFATWGRIMATFSGMKPCDVTKFLRNFGGKNVVAKSLFAGIQARNKRATDAAANISTGMNVANKIPGAPAAVKKMIGFYAKAMNKGPKVVAKGLENAITHPKQTWGDRRFMVEFTQNVIQDENAANDMLYTLKAIYN